MANYLNITTPLDSDEPAFRLASFSGQESLSRLFQFSLEVLSDRDGIEADEIVGKAVSFSFQDAKNEPRFFHGYVSRLSMGHAEEGFRHYRMEVVPWLWFLTRTSDCRIFAGKKVPDIVQTIFDEMDGGIQHPVEVKLAGSYRTWEYCVQYRETDFNFVSRLLEQEGVFYYFKHEKGKHTLVLCDRPSHFADIGAKLKYEYSYSGEPKLQSVTSWSREFQFVPGAYAQTDYNYETHPARSEKTPAKLLLAQQPAEGDAKKLADPEKYEIYDFPGEYDDKGVGDQVTEHCEDEEEAAFDTASGSSLFENLGAGVKFKLIEHPVGRENAEYAVTSIQHSAADSPFDEGLGETYNNRFTCIPSGVSFRPARITPKPAIHGVQTAVVVGPPGSEINTDEYGRVQVQFFWDRYGTRLQGGGDPEKQAEPIWIRVGQVMAGKNWGAMFIPRVGQEVIVIFLEGDPDRPIIAGMVYNADQMPPYELPANKTKTYFKSNSTEGGEGYNELQFDDAAGQEMIYMHAQRNMDVRVRNDSLNRTYGNRHQIIGWEKDGGKGGDQREKVYKDKHVTVDNDLIEHIGGNMKLLIGGIDGDGNQDIVVKNDKKELIENDSHVHVKSNRNEKVDMDQSLSVGMNQQEKVGLKHALDAGQEIHLKAGMNVVIEAGMQLTIKGPGGFITIDPSGVTVQGTMVRINSGGAAGTGSGSSPKDAEDAEEAQPTKPDMAHQDDPKSGEKSTPF